jgi:L-amino acid N-acyltransferase YncA
MIDLRAATGKDAAAIAAIYAPYVVTNAVSFEAAAPDAKEMRARIAATIGQYPWIVATDPASGVVLGYAYAKPLRPGEPYRFAAEVAVYAAGDLEGQGIRKQLMTSLLATLTEQNFTQAIVTLLTPNDKLIQFYEGCGLRRSGAYNEVGFKNGQWHDVGLWQRELAQAGVPPEELKPFSKVGVIRN